MKLNEIPELVGTIFEKCGIDCFAVGQRTTFITHEHRDHHPRSCQEFLVPIEILTERTQFVFERYPNSIKLAEGYRVVAKFRHAKTSQVPLYIFETGNKKIAVLGDYDKSHEVFRAIQKEQPDVVIIPVYSKIVEGRLQESRWGLYQEQRHLLNLLNSQRHWLKKRPVIIGLKHSPKARHEKGLDYFVDEKLESYAD
jgi:hypothetical protein